VKLVCAFLILFLGLSAEARVFKLKDETFAAYVHFMGGTSLIQKSSFERTDVTFSNKVDYNLSGDFGVLFAMSRANFKLGLEFIRPQVVSGAQAIGAGDVLYYRVTSGIISYGPVAGLDLILKAGESYRIYITTALGYMKTTLKNDYEFSSQGRTNYGGINDYTEEGSAIGAMGRGGLGLEFSLADTATLAFDVGYRSLTTTNLIHERTAVTLNGSVVSGGVMKDQNGNDRKVNLSGGWAGIGLRFYF